MSITVELSGPELAALKQVTKLNNEADAVARAAREYLRLSRLRELKAASGKVDYESDWQRLEALELDECDFPR